MFMEGSSIRQATVLADKHMALNNESLSGHSSLTVYKIQFFSIGQLVKCLPDLVKM